MSESVQRFMTRRVVTIGPRRPLTEAHRLMNELAIRHLPVLDGERLVGVVSQRDLHLIETLRGVKPEEVAVEEAMSPDVFTVEPGAPLASVVETMAERRLGSAVVVRRGAVVGIFTSVDALRALGTLLGQGTRRPAAARKPRRTTARVAAKQPREPRRSTARVTAKQSREPRRGR